MHACVTSAVVILSEVTKGGTASEDLHPTLAHPSFPHTSKIFQYATLPKCASSRLT